MKPLLNNWLTIRSRTTTSIQSAHNNQSIGNLEHLPGTTRGSQSVGRLLMQIYGIEWRATATVDHIQISSLLCGWPGEGRDDEWKLRSSFKSIIIIIIGRKSKIWMRFSIQKSARGAEEEELKHSLPKSSSQSKGARTCFSNWIQSFQLFWWTLFSERTKSGKSLWSAIN